MKVTVSKPKVLIVHNYYQIPGGEDTVVANERKMLEDNGHEVVLYIRKNVELKNISILQKLFLPITVIYSIRTYIEVRKIIRENKVDIVHVHNTLTLISPSVYYAAFSCKVPVVQTVHNFRLLCPGATFYRNGHICEDCMKHGLRSAIKYSCYRGSRLQTIANTSILLAHRFLGTYKKINYICLTEFTKIKLTSIVSVNQIYVKPNFTYDQGGNSTSKDYYVFVGRLEEIKGIDVLVDAFKLMPNRKLKIVGTGIYEKKIKARVENEKLDNIDIVGFKKKDEVNKLLKNAKALVMCSQWYETFGMVLVEAYSNGIPVIVGNVGNIRGMVVEGKTGELFQYNDPKALINAIKRFEENIRNDYRIEAYKLYKDKYNDEMNYIMLINIYRDIIKRVKNNE